MGRDTEMRRTQRLAQGAGLWCFWVRGPAKSSLSFFVHEAGAIPILPLNEIEVSGSETGGLELRPI